MFTWAVIFLIIAIIAAVLGFGTLAGTAAWAAKIVFVVGLILFIVSLFFRESGPPGRPSTPQATRPEGRAASHGWQTPLRGVCAV